MYQVRNNTNGMIFKGLITFVCFSEGTNKLLPVAKMCVSYPHINETPFGQFSTTYFILPGNTQDISIIKLYC